MGLLQGWEQGRRNGGACYKVGRGEEEWWGLLQGWEQGRRHGETCYKGVLRELPKLSMIGRPGADHRDLAPGGGSPDRALHAKNRIKVGKRRRQSVSTHATWSKMTKARATAGGRCLLGQAVLPTSLHTAEKNSSTTETKKKLCWFKIHATNSKQPC